MQVLGRPIMLVIHVRIAFMMIGGGDDDGGGVHADML